MRCPYCGHHDLKVVDSRDSEVGEAIRRRRECLKCLRRFTTYERSDEIPYMVVKKDGRREEFDRHKLLGGLLNASKKRDIAPYQLEALVDDVENTVRSRNLTEVPSREIGEIEVPESVRSVVGQRLSRLAEPTQEVLQEASVLGQGSQLKLRIPLTLAIVPALVVRCGGERYAIPQISLLELVRLGREGAGHEIEKIRESGNQHVSLTERGASFGYNNLVVDMRSLPVMRGYAPVVFDGTHSVQTPSAGNGVSGGQPEFIPVLARAAVAAGVDGVFLEVHDDPACAKSDGANALGLEKLQGVLEQLLRVHGAVQPQRV